MRKRKILLLIATLCAMPEAMSGSPNVTIDINVFVVAGACVIPPGEENIAVDFGNLFTKDLYTQSRTEGKEFVIHLEQCDTSQLNKFNVTFNGVESSGLPGLLALDSDSEASGIAIGLETDAGVLQKINEKGQYNTLSQGTNFIKMKAFIQAEPVAIAKKNIQMGHFSATAQFIINYM